MEQFQKFAESGFVKGKKMGFDELEIFMLRSKSLGVTVRNGKAEETNLSDIKGVGLRGIKDKRWGYAYTADFSPQGLQYLLEEALRNTAYSDIDEFAALPQKQQGYAPLGLYDSTMEALSLDAKIELALQAEQAAKNGDKRVAQVDKASYTEGESQVWIANTKGIMAYEKNTACSLSCVAIGEDNLGRDSGYGIDQAVWVCELNPNKVGEEAAMRATRLLSAKSLSNMTCDIILPAETAVDFLEMIAGSFSGESVLKGRSMFKQVGDMIASPLVNIVDDATLPKGLGSSEFDGEGVKTQRTILVQEGVLKGYLYDTKTALEANTTSTGNGMRGSYRTAPYIANSNYYLLPGHTKENDMIAMSEKAVMITDILGGHTANPITGDFSFGIAGLLIENGKIVCPIRGATMAGNFKDIFKNIDMLGDNLTFFGSIGAPSIRVKNVRISG